MTYIVIELQTSADGQVANLVYSFDNRAEAEQKYHLILAGAAVSTVPIHAAAILTNTGALLERHVYQHETSEEGV